MRENEYCFSKREIENMFINFLIEVKTRLETFLSFVFLSLVRLIIQLYIFNSN